MSHLARAGVQQLENAAPSWGAAFVLAPESYLGFCGVVVEESVEVPVVSVVLVFL